MHLICQTAVEDIACHRGLGSKVTPHPSSPHAPSPLANCRELGKVHVRQHEMGSCTLQDQFEHSHLASFADNWYWNCW